MKEFVPECVRQFVSVCLTNVNNIFCVCAFNYYRLSSFYSHLFALYVIKIDESWRLKLLSTCQCFMIILKIKK